MPRYLIHYLINFVYPPRCAACERRLPLETVQRVCADCLAAVERLHDPLCTVCGVPVDPGRDENPGGWCRGCSTSPPAFTQARAITRYRADDEERAPVPSMIRRHKYGRDQSLTHALAECVGEPLPLAENDYDLVVPVPLHHTRLRWRGFNQAALIEYRHRAAARPPAGYRQSDTDKGNVLANGQGPPSTPSQCAQRLPGQTHGADCESANITDRRRYDHRRDGGRMCARPARGGRAARRRADPGTSPMTHEGRESWETRSSRHRAGDARAQPARDDAADGARLSPRYRRGRRPSRDCARPRGISRRRDRLRRNRDRQLHDIAARRTFTDLAGRRRPRRQGLPFVPGSFDAVVNTNFLDRNLIAPLKSSSRIGGTLFFDTFLVDQAVTGHPRDPRFLLRHYELREMLSDMELFVIAKA